MAGSPGCPLAARYIARGLSAAAAAPWRPALQVGAASRVWLRCLGGRACACGWGGGRWAGDGRVAAGCGWQAYVLRASRDATVSGPLPPVLVGGGRL